MSTENHFRFASMHFKSINIPCNLKVIGSNNNKKVNSYKLIFIILRIKLYTREKKFKNACCFLNY